MKKTAIRKSAPAAAINDTKKFARSEAAMDAMLLALGSFAMLLAVVLAELLTIEAQSQLPLIHEHNPAQYGISRARPGCHEPES
jgi:hypothetical protein